MGRSSRGLNIRLPHSPAFLFCQTFQNAYRFYWLPFYWYMQILSSIITPANHHLFVLCNYHIYTRTAYTYDVHIERGQECLPKLVGLMNRLEIIIHDL